MRDRLLNLDRVPNFRDFGGYRAQGGRVKRGMLYRSASFHDASDADIAKLDALGVRFLVDLRHLDERTSEPNRWPGATCRTIANDEGARVEMAPHLAFLLQSEITPASVTKYMDDAYRGFPFNPRYIALYRDWFRELGEGGPGVIHCAAGKDRTGLGCALTLLALGVSEDDAFADYEFTNKAVNIEARLPRIQAHLEQRLQRKLDAAALRPMLGVDADYLRSAFNAISAKHGSVEAYLENVLGVGAREREKLREKLLD